MADDPISSAAAHLAVLENETQHPHQPNEVDHMAESIERRVSGAVNTLSAWWQGMHDQARTTLDRVNAQGGVLASAQKELARLEDHIQAQSDRARELARSTEAPAVEGATFELGDDETMGSGAPVRSSSQATSSDVPATMSGLSTQAWDTLRSLLAHPRVSQLQEQVAALTPDAADREAMQDSLKEAEAIARQHMGAGGAALQKLSLDLQARLQSLSAKLEAGSAPTTPRHENPPSLKASHASPVALSTPVQEAPPFHVVGDDDFAWEDDAAGALSPVGPPPGRTI